MARKTTAKKKTKSAGKKAPKATFTGGGLSHGAIAEAAYYLAEERGFEGGHSMDDWFLAEEQLKKLHGF